METIYTKDWFEERHNTQFEYAINNKYKYLFDGIDFKGKFVCDYGGGTGSAGFVALENGAKYVCNYDPFTDKSFYKKINYVKTLPRRKFDIVICSDVIEHLTNDEQKIMTENIYKLLKSDGLLLLNTPNKFHLKNKDWAFKPRGHINPKTAKEIKKLFNNKFKIINFKIRGVSRKSYIKWIEKTFLSRYFGGHLFFTFKKATNNKGG